MGPCQGKTCGLFIAKEIAEITGISIEKLNYKTYTLMEELLEEIIAGDEVENKASVVVIGGGVVGNSVAYNLAKRGVKDIVLVERSFLASGATGRCGAGVRQQWGTRQNCLLARESMRVFENFKDTLNVDVDIELKQKGYLLLAYSDNELGLFKRNIEVQNSLDIPSKLVTLRKQKI